MSWIVDFYRSALGKKTVMAVTGIILFGFVFGHMVGNLKLYQGAYEAGDHAGEYALDVYAEGLREIGAPVFGHAQVIWMARMGLLVALLLHVHAAWGVTRQSRAARETPYRKWRPRASSYASRTMRWTGVILLLFVVYHLLHLTVGTVHEDFVPGSVHHNVVSAFENPVIAIVYVLANLALGFHLFHGLWSLFQTLGFFGPRLNAFRRQLAIALATVVTLGNISFPLAVLTGLVG